jgi:hypothetical protein
LRSVLDCDPAQALDCDPAQALKGVPRILYHVSHRKLRFTLT